MASQNFKLVVADIIFFAGDVAVVTTAGIKTVGAKTLHVLEFLADGAKNLVDRLALDMKVSAITLPDPAAVPASSVAAAAAASASHSFLQ